MKIVWHSNAPWAPTGYGQQTALFGPRIRDLGHDLAYSAFWGLGGAPLDWDGTRVYPADDDCGNRTLPAIARHHAQGEDVLVITLMDNWALVNPAFAELRIGAWCPVDHAPLPPRVNEFFELTGATPIAMSRFGQRELERAGYPALYVPHGVDTSVFTPRDTRDETRERMGIDPDAYVVGMVAANKGNNPPRKAFPQVFLAFSQLLKADPDAILYLHTDLTGGQTGVNLGALAKACGIPTSAIRYTPPVALELGVDQDTLAHLYSAFDVLAHPSYGEGFGVPIIESQACGTPVIVTDFTAMPELCGAGWTVDGDLFYDPTQGAFYKSPAIAEVYDALLEARERRGDQQLRELARSFALGYDADTVTRRFWRPALEQLTAAAPVAGDEVIHTRPPNRAERRAAGRAKAPA